MSGEECQMRIYIINLDADHERFAFMSSQLSARGLSFERFPATHHTKMSPEQQAYARASKRRHLKPGEIGCMLSHIELWKEVATRDDELALILEDDVHVSEDFNAFLAALRISSSEVCIHRLETFLARVTMRRSVAYTSGPRTAKQLLSHHGGTGAYIINRPTALTLLQLSPDFRHSVDIEMFDPRRGVGPAAIKLYQWLPAPCIQDMLIPRLDAESHGIRRGFVTHLPERMDFERIAKKSRRKEALKRALRPAVTFAQDAALRFAGRTRRYVAFG